MKKIIVRNIFILFFLLVFNDKCFGISDKFKFVIDTIGIPQYNVLGDEINEDIYNTYNLFVYSNPIDMYARTNIQRFKEVTNKGKWCKSGGSFNGYGIRGEYNVLGVSYSGSIINNVYFPVDNVPETTPDNWNYISVSGAYESWENNYKYKEQLEFMKNTNLLFDKIDYLNNISDSYELLEYNISPISIGLDKVKLNTASTWKTGGIVTVKRINAKGEIRDATMSTKPMAAEANVKSKLDIDNNLNFEEKEEIKIPIMFGANAVNLNKYAKVEHIKKIISILYIDGKEISRVEGDKIGDISKSIYTIVPNERVDASNNFIINIKVKSYLYTEFYVDGLMQDIIDKNITIQIKEKDVVPVDRISVKVLEKENNKYVIKDFIITKNTLNKSIGLTEKNKYLAIKIKFNNEFNDNENINIYINENKVASEKIDENDDNIYKIRLEGCPNTLLGWNEYRNKSGSYYNMNFKNIGNRIREPNCIRLEFINESNVFEEKIYFDVIDDYKLNLNYILEGVMNKEALSSNTKLSEWSI